MLLSTILAFIFAIGSTHALALPPSASTPSAADNHSDLTLIKRVVQGSDYYEPPAMTISTAIARMRTATAQPDLEALEFLADVIKHPETGPYPDEEQEMVKAAVTEYYKRMQKTVKSTTDPFKRAWAMGHVVAVKQIWEQE
ncbi:hypothetical protein FRB99_008156 [Tulasnella sp. 403]|nr:hypothetical protein FRB99_008156 [Tulasnella sp. 403]